jgi:hypothetical protein
VGAVMSNDSSKGFVLATVFVLFFCAVGILTGRDIAVSIERAKAIEAGAGQWTVNPKTGGTEFKYGK